MEWEHRDPSNTSFRTSNVYGYANDGTDHHPAELDPLGANAGTDNPYLIDPNPPDENPSMLPYPSFSDPRHPGMTYSVDGIRVPVDFFMLQLDIGTHSEFGIVEAFAKASTRAVGYRNSGVSWGTPFDATYDENGRPTGISWGDYDPDMAEVNYGNENLIYADSGSFSSLLTFIQPQNPGLTPFTGKNLRKYDKQRAIVRDSLENSDSCRQFLAAHGIDPDAALDAVNQQLAYNGPKSTISRLQAGTVDLSDPDFQSMQLNDPTRAAAILNGPVSGDFRSAGRMAETAFYPGGVFGATPADRSTVFFRKSGLTGGNILHEALHSLTGLNDELLARQLGVEIPSSGVTDIITQTLIQHGCGVKRKR